jgi:hypothetical protein
MVAIMALHINQGLKTNSESRKFVYQINLTQALSKTNSTNRSTKLMTLFAHPQFSEISIPIPPNWPQLGLSIEVEFFIFFDILCYKHQ